MIFFFFFFGCMIFGCEQFFGHVGFGCVNLLAWEIFWTYEFGHGKNFLDM